MAASEDSVKSDMTEDATEKSTAAATEATTTSAEDTTAGKSTAAATEATTTSAEEDTTAGKSTASSSGAVKEGNTQSQSGGRGYDRPTRSDRFSRGDRPRGGRPGGRRSYRRKKVDYYSVNKIDDINYKDVQILKQFIGDRGKILPRRHTGLSAMHQRKLKIAIKRARSIALLPFAGDRDLVIAPKVEEKAF